MNMKIFPHLDRDGDTSKKIILICSLGRLSHLLEEPPDASDSLDFIQFLDSFKNIFSRVNKSSGEAKFPVKSELHLEIGTNN